MEKESCTKFCVILVIFHEVIKLQSSVFNVSDVIPGKVQNISPLVFFAFLVASFMEKKTPIKFYGVFDHFSRTYEVAKFRMIKLYLDVSHSLWIIALFGTDDFNLVSLTLQFFVALDGPNLDHLNVDK